MKHLAHVQRYIGQFMMVGIMLILTWKCAVNKVYNFCSIVYDTCHISRSEMCNGVGNEIQQAGQIFPSYGNIMEDWRNFTLNFYRSNSPHPTNLAIHLLLHHLHTAPSGLFFITLYLNIYFSYKSLPSLLYVYVSSLSGTFAVTSLYRITWIINIVVRFISMNINWDFPVCISFL
jgi:hypothetical protein